MKSIDMSKLVQRANAKVFLAETLHGDKYWFEGRLGEWRTLPNGNRIFIPDDATDKEIDDILDKYGGIGDTDEPKGEGTPADEKTDYTDDELKDKLDKALDKMIDKERDK